MCGLMTGALLGAGLAMLFAPRRGSELRSQLSDAATTLANSASRTYRQATDTATEWAERGRKWAVRPCERRGRLSRGRGRRNDTSRMGERRAVPSGRRPDRVGHVRRLRRTPRALSPPRSRCRQTMSAAVEPINTQFDLGEHGAPALQAGSNACSQADCPRGPAQSRWASSRLLPERIAREQVPPSWQVRPRRRAPRE